MKFRRDAAIHDELRSSPTRGMWIEITVAGDLWEDDKSSPTRGMWIEISTLAQSVAPWASSPTRGMWIEIALTSFLMRSNVVIPHTGDVD